MSERFSLHQLYVLVIMEFQRFGVPVIRQELADQCAYEVFMALEKDLELRELVPEVYAWRSHQTEDGREWYYPQEESGLGSCNVDSRHIGGQQLDQTGVRVSIFDCTLAYSFSDVTKLEPLVAKTIRPYVLEEAELRSDFERSLRAAEREVADKYKGMAEERFKTAMAIARSGAS